MYADPEVGIKGQINPGQSSRPSQSYALTLSLDAEYDAECAPHPQPARPYTQPVLALPRCPHAATGPQGLPSLPARPPSMPSCCHSALTLPLRLRASRFTTLEALLYENDELPADWGQVVYCSSIGVYCIIVVYGIVLCCSVEV